MVDFSDIPIKKILFDTLVEMGRLSSNPSESTIQTIRDISDSDALKLLKSLPGGGPELKNMGGMMNIDDMTAPLGYAHGGIAGYEGGGSTELQERIDKLIIDIQVENMSPDPNYKRIDGLNNQLKYFTSLLKD